jgi:hypothetical protein
MAARIATHSIKAILPYHAPMASATPAITEEDRRVLRNTRRLRTMAYACVALPVVVTVGIVALNRLTSGGLRFFVNGEPWTHTFWNGLFYSLLAGVVLLLATVSRVCPRCGNGFFSRTGYNPRVHSGSLGETGARFNVNVFASRCINCGLGLRD